MFALWCGRGALGLTAVEPHGITLPGADARPAPGGRRRCGNLHRTEHRMPPGLFRTITPRAAPPRSAKTSPQQPPVDPSPERWPELAGVV